MLAPLRSYGASRDQDRLRNAGHPKPLSGAGWLGRRALLGAGAFLPAIARARSGLSPEWSGTYDGAARFYRSIPLEDIYPPPTEPHVDLDNPTPFGVNFEIRTIDDLPTIRLRIDTGPLQTAASGELLRFGPLIDGVAVLAANESRHGPRSAILTVGRDLLSTEALFAHADGSFWRRHFTVRFTPIGGDIILWVFDAAGTRARTWRGSAVKRS
ncbi:MAG: hypothetical protein HYX38_14725 [Rhodospirillales bacterium]|nr:hypothetical protein [Rhodospirillales bacterium]